MIAGVVKAIEQLHATNLKVTAYLGFARNSIGPEAYVSDELMLSRAGRRSRSRSNSAGYLQFPQG